MPQALVSLGSNLGDRQSTLDRAVAGLNTGDSRVVTRSPWYETPPVGGPLGQEPFANGVVRLETSLEPHQLLAGLQTIEAQAGRVRAVEWGPRTLDLDLLFYDDRVIDSPDLVVPHPRAAFRKFVLEGAAAVAPDFRHPILGRTLAELLAHLRTAPRYVVLVGANTGFRNQLAGEAAHVATARLVEPTDPSLPASVDQVACDIGLGDGPVCNSPAAGGPIEFVRGRAAAIARSLADGDDWFVDDAWLPAEALQLYLRLPVERRAEFVAVCQEVWRTLPPPRLVACIVGANVVEVGVLGAGDAADAVGPCGTARHAAAVAVPAAAPWRQVLPPVVDLVVADRERALVELAAAMDAAG